MERPRLNMLASILTQCSDCKYKLNKVNPSTRSSCEVAGESTSDGVPVPNITVDKKGLLTCKTYTPKQPQSYPEATIIETNNNQIH